MRSKWLSQNKRFGIIKKYYSYRAVPARPEIREKRAKRQNVTKETQAAVNRRLRAEKLSRLIVDNYEAGDLYLTCTCREHMTAEEIHKAFDEQFKRRLRALYKKAGVPLKYISVLENLKGGGRPHGHILIPALGREWIEKIRGAWRHGNVEIRLYGGHLTDAEKLAEYFTKEKIEKKSGRIQPSKNLVRTEPKKERVTRAEAYNPEITAPRGYRIIKELSYSTYTMEGYPISIAYFERTDHTEKGDKKSERVRRLYTRDKKTPAPLSENENRCDESHG